MQHIASRPRRRDRPAIRQAEKVTACSPQPELWRLQVSISNKPASFHWADPLLLDQQITQEERMVRDSAAAYCQERLAPRVLEAFRNEKTDPADLSRDGRAGPVGPHHSGSVRRRRAELRLLRTGGARSRAGRLGLPLDDERAVVAGDGADQRVRQRSDEAEVPAQAGHRRIDRLLRPHGTESRFRPRQHDLARQEGRWRLPALGHQDVDHEQPHCRRVRGLGQGRRRRRSAGSCWKKAGRA